MAGGEGTRLWPLSTKAKPKQFFDITGVGKSLIRQTFERFNNFIPTQNIIIVTANSYINLVKKEIPELPIDNILGEPYVRDTSPAIAYATYSLLKRDPDATMVVSPADILIENEDAFKEAILSCLEYAAKGDNIVTLGVKATRPEKNFGYIQVNNISEHSETSKFIPIKTFIEKPAEELAQVLISTGEFFWNSGLYVWTAKTIKSELETHLPELAQLFNKWDEYIGTEKEVDFINSVYSGCIKSSISYGVLEKTSKAYFHLSHFGWIDIGSWSSINQVYSSNDSNNNACNSKFNILNNSTDNLIISKDEKKLIFVQDLSEYMIIDTDKALVICPRSNKNYQGILDESRLPELKEYR